MNNEQQTNTGNITRDEEMDVLSLLSSKPEEDIIEENNNESEDLSVKMTPLRKMMLEKEKNPTGLIVSNEDLEKGKGPKRLKSMLENDDRVDSITKYAQELDKDADIASKILAPKPKNKEETVMLMQAIEEIKETGSIKTHNIIADQIIMKPDDYDENREKYEQSQVTQENDKSTENKQTEEIINDAENRSNIVQILIDKTGFGTNIEFSDEEKSKITHADEIQIVQVEKKELETIKYAKPIPQNSFQSVIQQYQLGHSSTPVIFPCSRFRARMRGLSYGELSDISLNPETTSIEDTRRRLSVIYNKMSSASVGEFKDFNDFLHKFAYEDIQLAIFGLVVSTFPEEEEVALNCGNKKCPGASTDRDGNFIATQYTKKYCPRTLLDYEACGNAMLEWTQKISELKGEEAQQAFKESPIQQYTTIKLPHSEFILELSRLSCYDFLTSYQDGIKYLEERFPEYDSENIEAGGIGSRDFTMAVTILPILQYVRSISIKNSDGEYVKFYTGRDIAEALTTLDTVDIRVLITIVGDVDDYSVSFALRDCVCPQCGNRQKELKMTSLDQLVFLTYQQQMNLGINSQNSVHL